MSFSLPTFNLDCNIVTGGSTWPWTARLTVKGNLAWGRRVSQHNETAGAQNLTLLLPAGTDVRAGPVPNPPGNDLVEVPAGSGRSYIVLSVDDIGKGFPNEHRAAILTPTSVAMTAGGTHYWPTPFP